MRLIQRMFSRKWMLTTLLVFAGAALCVQLGIWQLDRLSQRRAFNAHYLAVRAESPLDLNQAGGQDLSGLEYRDAFAEGSYDFDHQVALRNQYNGNEYGYHLLTPLILGEGTAIVVDRGWIPAEGNDTSQARRHYDEPGMLRVKGILRLGRSKAELGGVADPTLTPGETGLELWNAVNLERIGEQVPYKLLPVYLQPDPEPGDVTPPIPFQPEIELSEGPHAGYAGQWFIFATLLFLGYPFFYLRRQEN
jgi:surfeit locus 1 family protein